MAKKILLGIITFLFIGSDSLTAQSIKKRVGYLNAIGDSIRFSICKNIIDTLMADKKVDELIIKYDDNSDHYIINEEYIRAIRYTMVKADSSIIANFNSSLRFKFRNIPKVSIDSIGSQNVSFLEEYYLFGRTANVVYILLQNPIEGWEPLKIPIYYLRYQGLANTRFSNVLVNFPFILSIPVRVMYNDGKAPRINCYIFNYQIELDLIKKLPGWSFKSKVLLY